MMYTQCPECQTRFRITEAQLQQADGQVICGQCQTRFFARERLTDALAGYPAEPYIDESAADRQDDVSPRMPAQVDLSGVTESQQPASTEAVEIPHAIADDLARQQHPQAATHWRYFAQWVVVLVLFVVMLAQGAYLYRFELARDPVYAPLVRNLCGWVGCELPLPRVPGRIAVLDRDVRLHPRVDQALVVNATLVNQADFVQAYPLIELRMSDVAGTQIAGRWFRPEDYLRQAVSVAEGMLPGKEVHLLLEVIDPGEDVVSFQLNFR